MPNKTYPYNFEHHLSLWSNIKNDLLKQYGQKVFVSWFNKIHFLGNKSGLVLLGVKTKFLQDWIQNNYFELVLKLWKQYDSSIKNIELTVIEDLEYPDNHGMHDNIAPIPDNNSQGNLDIFSNTLDKRFTFDNFVVGSSNELAYSASRAVSEANSAILESNPLFLYGGVGLGKTHLMQSIAWHITRSNKGRKFIYISAEKFMHQFVKALRNKNLLAFKEYFRSVDVLMIDDIQFICGKDSTQEEFFHTFNTLIDNRRQMVISCDRSPADLDNIEDRIKSRLGWGLVADVHSTNYELRIGILQSKIEQMGVLIPQDTIEFLAGKITSNVRELEGALNKLVAHSNFTKKTINLVNTQELLKDLIKANDRAISIDSIKKTVARHYCIKISDMSSSLRKRNISQPRQLAMYLTKLLTPKSLSEIGKHFGDKDHTTVMHAIKKIESLCKTDLDFANEVSMLKSLLKR